MKAILALALVAGCKWPCDNYVVVPGSCITTIDRLDTQPRFCNDQDPDPKLHCFGPVKHCDYICVKPDGGVR